MRSETQQVFAQPDGTLQAQINLEPVRVHRADGSWVPADTTLHVQPDGSVAPQATVVDMVFSGGGSGPLVSVSKFGKSLSLSWPGTLPTPTLDGDTATYPDVWPDVDLRVIADSLGFSDQLVVKTAAAAASPALASVSFGLATQGLTVAADASGALTAKDSAGGTVFRAPVPMMWDTATQTAAPNVGAADGSAPDDPSVPGEHTAPLGVQVDQANLVLTPDQSILTGADTVFPVVVEPSVTYGLSAWTEVNAEDPNSATWRTVPSSLAVGFQDFESPWSRVRSFMRFPLDSRIYGTTILSAQLNLFENWSSSCNARAFELWVTGGFSSATTWNNQPTWGSHLSNANVAYGHEPDCADHGVELDATSGIAGAARNRTGITFGIKAADENDHLGWKKFNTNPTVTVVYNRPPDTPSASTMSTAGPTTKCSTVRTAPVHANVTLALGVNLVVKTHDPDGDKVRVYFDFRKDGATSSLAAPISDVFSPGSTSSGCSGRVRLV